MKNTPMATNAMSGSSLATLATTMSLVPCSTPRMFTHASSTNMATMTGTRMDGKPKSAPSPSAKADATPATAVVPSIHSSTPARKPT